MAQKKVIVGMSGGVDSSVSALLLKEQGYDVIGLFMKNWEEADHQGHCRAAKEYEDVIAVCDQLQIPHHSVNFTKTYQSEVFAHTLEEFAQGRTPNPDTLCNREIKFKVLLEKALELGACFLATGHYCQNQGGHLMKGRDRTKDQSYFLYTVNASILQKVLFPLGGLKKTDVRRIAAAHHLATAHKKDSTGLCYIGERNFKQFLNQYLPFRKGNFETLSGKVVGEHDGCAFYTIGQRKGLKIGGAGEAWFVVDKDVQRNVVFVEQGADHPALYSKGLIATELSWVAEPPSSLPFQCKAKIRYRQEDQECTLENVEDGDGRIVFSTPQRAVTQGQAIVFYDGEKCLGGGIIKRRLP
jgi:tRNA-uridine 2-sulfurtransferase